MLGPDLAGWLLDLPPALTRRVRIKRRLPVRMRDGIMLRADHYAPDLPAPVATVLVRTPYGRGFAIGQLCRSLARRGFHVVIQSCRGTADSGGSFEPLLQERDDGLDTLDWLRRQPWYDGRLCTFGPSYVGFVQWAIADAAGPDLRAMSTLVTASQFGDSTYAGGAFSLDTVLTWAALLEAQRGPTLPNVVELLRGQPKLQRGLAHQPMGEADQITTGVEIAFFRRWLTENDPTGPYWTERGHHHRLADVRAPVLMTGGWYDIFLPWQVADFQALRAAGADPHLTIGPWHHGSPALLAHAASESIAWFTAHTQDQPPPREHPVKVFMGGNGGWQEYPDWPPPGTTTQSWHFQPGGGLSPTPPEEHQPLTAFTFDPNDPTPAVGGPRLVGKLAGRRDNRDLELRTDVVLFTSDPLPQAVEVIGPVAASLSVQASAPYFDTFVRLCDLDPNGHSWNVCDGLTRTTSTVDGMATVRVELWPTAYRFRAGHRIRVQVSGGAHPRFACNPGTGAALGEPTDLVPVHRTLYTHSSIDLPVGSDE